VLVQPKRNKQAAAKLMRNLLKRYAFVLERLVPDDHIAPRVGISGSNPCMGPGMEEQES
jgi:hypothetical protein